MDMFASAERIELAAVWDELIAGTCKVESWSHDKDSWSMVVTRHPQPGNLRPQAPRPRDVEILEQTLLRGVRKSVASEVKLSCSSIAVIMQTCFQYMGVDCLPSRIPGLVVVACHARRQQGPKFRPYPRLVKDRFQVQTIRIPRPDLALAPWLAPAEHAVIALLIEGQSYAEIAQLRRTSIRTVANQVASGFRRLGVSGRAELLCLLARWAFEPPAPPAKRPPSLAPANGRKSAGRGLALAQAALEEEPCLSPSPAT
jgi:DNA-binding CsgD family transcriptional regulator